MLGTYARHGTSVEPTKRPVLKYRTEDGLRGKGFDPRFRVVPNGTAAHYQKRRLALDDNKYGANVDRITGC
jgi:hypothetical protein